MRHARHRHRRRPPETGAGTRACRSLSQARAGDRPRRLACARSRSSKFAKAAPQDAERRRVEESIAIANVIPERAIDRHPRRARRKPRQRGARGAHCASGAPKTARRSVLSSAAPTAWRRACASGPSSSSPSGRPLGRINSCASCCSNRFTAPPAYSPATPITGHDAPLILLNPVSLNCDGRDWAVSYSGPNHCFFLRSRGLLSTVNSMILRRSRPTDPRLVLGSALALALPLGANLAAFAQTPSAQVPLAPAPPPSTPARRRAQAARSGARRRPRAAARIGGQPGQAQAADRGDERGPARAQSAAHRHRRRACATSRPRSTQRRRGSNRSTSARRFFRNRSTSGAP